MDETHDTIEGPDGRDPDAGPSVGGPRDRRRAIRYEPKMPRAWLGWQLPDDFRATPVRLIDIGAGGCRVACREPVPSAGTLLLRLEGAILPAWFELAPMEVRAFGPEAYLIRLTFPETCPYDLFMAAAFGRASVDAAGRQPELSRFFAGGAILGPVPEEAAAKAGRRDDSPAGRAASQAFRRSSYAHLAR